MSQIIDISKPTLKRQATVLIYGDSGSGKTWWAAQWPRVRFLSDAVEGGYETLYDPDLKKLWFESSWTPQVRAISTLQDMEEEIRKLKEDVKKGGPTAPQTAVFDSASFFMMLLEQHYRTHFAAAIDKNHFWLWNQIAQRMLNLLKELHTAGLHVIWTALAESGEKGYGPFLTGKTAKTLPAACKYILYATQRQGAKVTDPPIHEIRTKRSGPWPARVRGKFPDPLIPTYRAFAKAAGMLPRPVPVTTARPLVTSR